MKYIISLGANIGDCKDTLRKSLSALRDNKDCYIKKRSPIYRTPPWGKCDQPDFFNAVIEVEWKKTPEELMTFLLETEKKFGRVRRIPWGPRTLDLDLIYGYNVERNTDFLKLPHPFFWDRLFVLIPLSDIEPEFTYENKKIICRINELGDCTGIKKEENSWED